MPFYTGPNAEATAGALWTTIDSTPDNDRQDGHNRAAKQGRQSAVNLCVHTQGHRVTINEGKPANRPVDG